MMRSALLSRLRRDETAATLTEFGFVGPILILMIFGIFDIAHTQYTAAIVNGSMQKAGRDISLETGVLSEDDIDRRVEQAILGVAPKQAEVTYEKLSHFDFSDIGEAEDFTDTNNDKICNNGESFDDSNGNGQWDASRGKQGIGGARDAVLYTAEVSYPRLFPLQAFIPTLPSRVTVEASTVLRNQPYDTQNTEVPIGQCD